MVWRTLPADRAIERLNALPYGEAVDTFAQCCAAAAWAHAMAGLRPYADTSALLDTADRVWSESGETAWREAFAGHPRIGEREAAAPAGATAQHWSEQEQARVLAADADVRAELAAAQREYEKRFGHVFLICATGMSAPDILAALRRRLGNDRATELRTAAEEQRRITRLRLEKLLTS